MALSRGSASWIATLVAVTFLSGCITHHPSTYDGGGGGGAPSAGGGGGIGNHEEGIRDGEIAAEAGVVAGYFVLGAITAPLIVLCIIAAVGAKDGPDDCIGPPNCGGSVGGPGPVVIYAPHVVATHSLEYRNGFDSGYNRRMDERRGNAFLFGFIVGLALTAGAFAIYVASEDNRDKAEDDIGQHMTAGGSRRGATLLEF